MIGAIVGDIVGSRFENANIRRKCFRLFDEECQPTDDSIMSLAIAAAVLNSSQDDNKLRADAVRFMQDFGRKHPAAGYGGRFSQWIYSSDPKPYNSFGNGAAMRVSACGFAAESLDDAKRMSRCVTEVTHNHFEGIKGAEAVSVAVFMAKSGATKKEIKKHINKYYYSMKFRLSQIRKSYEFDVSCQGSVPQAIKAFLESRSFVDAIRNAISIGGDSDTIAAIAGSIAEAYYGVPLKIRNQAMTYLDETELDALKEFEDKYGTYPPKRH